MTKIPNVMRAVLRAVALGLIGLYVFTFALKNVTLQWDFKSYMLAARAALAGLDPYQIDALSAIAGKPVAIPFLYPPIALVPFVTMVPLSPDIAAMAWIAFKCWILLGLIIG